MIMDDKQLMRLQTMMYELSNGVDPTSGLVFGDDTILNNATLKKAFESTSEILGALIQSDRTLTCAKSAGSYKSQFHLFPEDTKKIQISESPVTVSKLTFMINSVRDNSCVKKLKATQITFWLTNRGFLQIVDPAEGHPYKVPTEKGLALGIHSEIKINAAGIEYAVNYYSAEAQRYIVSNINQITDYFAEDIHEQ